MALVIHTPYQDFQGLNRFSNGKFSQKWYYIFKIKKYKFVFFFFCLAIRLKDNAALIEIDLPDSTLDNWQLPDVKLTDYLRRMRVKSR